MTSQTPSVDPANLGSLTGAFREILSKMIQNLDDMLPAKVISYNRTTNLAEVQPLIMVIKTDTTIQARATVASIPVLQLGGGNFMLNFNINPGDIGFIKANDRDISLFMQSFTQTPPNTYRKHSFSDAIFIPAPMHNMTINSEDASNVVLSTLDGTQRVAIWPNQIKITSNSLVIIDAPVTEFTGVITTGTNVGYGGTATINGTLTATVDVIGGGISSVNHVHTEVSSGIDNTGPSTG
jgi:protein gp138